MFNKEQLEHAEYLGTIPPEKRCWCGWFLLGKCPNCKPGLTLADKLAERKRNGTKR